MESKEDIKQKMLSVACQVGGCLDGFGQSSNGLDTIYLVACVSKKKNGRLPAKDLYDSDWFKKARQYVERTRSPWYILSAEHGLLSPETVISSYNRTLNDMSLSQKRDWADRVWNRLNPIVCAADRVVILAGNNYRRFLQDKITATGCEVIVPMKGLQIGKQLQWLKKELMIDD